MKKLFLSLTLLFLITFSSALSAEGNCNISSGPSSKIVEYIKDLDSTLTALSKKATSNCNSSKDYENSLKRSNTRLTNDYNQVLDIGSFSSSFGLTKLVVDGELVDPVYRDYNLLKSQTDKINRYSRIIASKCAFDINIEDAEPINNFVSKYSLVNPKNIEDTFTVLRNINGEIFSTFINTVIGEKYMINDSSLVGMKSLQDNIILNYSGNNLDGCKEDYGSGIYDKLEKIFDNGSYINNGFKVWKDSFMLLMGGTSNNNYRLKERKLLQAELSKQGLSAESAEKSVANLDKINKCDSDFACIAEEQGRRVNDTFGYVGTFFKEAYNDITDPKNQTLRTKYKYGNNTAYTRKRAANTDEYMAMKKQIDNNVDIFKDVESSYASIISQIDTENNTLDSNVGNLITLYFNLVKTNKKIKDGVLVSEQLCDCQAQGVGNCHY